MFGESHPGFHYFTVDAFNIWSLRMTIIAADDESEDDYRNAFRVCDDNGDAIHFDSYDQKQNLNGIFDLNINYTLVGFTQIRVDISPLGYSATTPFVIANYLGDVNKIVVISNGLTVNVLDLDCE